MDNLGAWEEEALKTGTGLDSTVLDSIDSRLPAKPRYRYGTVRYHTVPYGTVPNGTVPVPYGTVPYAKPQRLSKYTIPLRLTFWD